VPHRPPLVDIHCHLLPGIDDGAANWNETLAMARLAVADGISAVVATVHQSGGSGCDQVGEILALTDQLRELLGQRGISLQVLPGAEVRIEPEMAAKFQSGQLLTLANRRRHVLLELPHEVYFPLDRLMPRLRAAGMVPILAHPERNLGILGQPGVLEPLVNSGCLLQVTAGSFMGAFGRQTQKLAYWLLQRRWVHFVGTDAHGAEARRPLLCRAYDCVAKLAGQQAADQLCCHNPAAVLAGKNVKHWPLEPGRRTWGGWRQRKRAG